MNLDKLTYAGNLENLASVAHLTNYSFVKGDICDRSVVDQAMNGVDAVVHFAPESHLDRPIFDPYPFVSPNGLGTYVLLKSAFKAKFTRFHHISTDEVYGSLELSNLSKFNERTPYNPKSPYSASKAGSDHLVNAYYHTYGLPMTITNCSNNFGPFQFPEKLIPLAITNIMEGKKVPLYGDGKNVRDWLYVEDHCRAIELVLQKGTIGETYCIGGLTRDIDNRTVIKKILQLMGGDESMIEYIPDRPGHDRRYAMDWSKIKNELGWEPFRDFDTWLASTVHWYKAHESWWRPLKK